MWIVTHADGITAHLAKLHKTTVPHLRRNSSTKTTGIVMYTDTFENIRLSVQEKSFIRVETEGADSNLLRGRETCACGYGSFCGNFSLIVIICNICL